MQIDTICMKVHDWQTDDDIESFCKIGNRTLKVKENAPCMLVPLIKLFAIIMQNKYYDIIAYSY